MEIYVHDFPRNLRDDARTFEPDVDQFDGLV